MTAPAPRPGPAVKAAAADALAAAERARRAIEPLTGTWPDLDVRTAYEIQDELLRRRLALGEQLVGVKLGLTSAAKQKRMGIDSPLVAWLTDAMALPAGTPVPLGELIHPRAEPELVFVMRRALRGPGMTAAAALDAVGGVCAGVEVIDSRFADFRFRLPDVIADNASSARYVTGPVLADPKTVNLAMEAVLLHRNGVLVDTATGAAVQGHPAEALALAVNVLSERDLGIEEGWVVLTGGMTDATPLAPGVTITAEYAHLGSIHLSGEQSPRGRERESA